MLYKIIFVILVLFENYSSTAQTAKDTSSPVKRGQYALVAYVGGGVSFYVNNVGLPEGLNAAINKISPYGTLRIMWHPDHLLRVGLESGWLNFYSYKFQDSSSGKVRVRAVPLILVFSMQVGRHINFFAGPAYYFIHSELDYEGVVNSPSHSLGLMVAGSYIHNFNKDIGIGAEFKWLNDYESKDSSLSFQIDFIWKMLKW